MKNGNECTISLEGVSDKCTAWYMHSEKWRNSKDKYSTAEVNPYYRCIAVISIKTLWETGYAEKQQTKIGIYATVSKFKKWITNVKVIPIHAKSIWNNMYLICHVSIILMFKFVTDVSQRQARFVDNSKLYLPTGNQLNVLQIVFNMQLVLSGTKCPCTFEKQKAPQLLSQPI